MKLFQWLQVNMNPTRTTFSTPLYIHDPSVYQMASTNTEDLQNHHTKRTAKKLNKVSIEENS